jgi:predicted dienelactone hydrolase
MRCAVVALLVLVALSPAFGAHRSASCIRSSGNTGRKCLDRYVDEIGTCRLRADAACETAARADGGPIDALLAETADHAATKCTDATAVSLGYLDLDDVGVRVPEACGDFGDDLLDLAFADSASGALLGCQGAVAQAVDRLRETVARAFGDQCYVAPFAGGRCNRRERDRRVAEAAKHAHRRIVDRCGAAFDALRLVAPDAGPTLDGRVDALLGIIVQRGRHFAQRVFPPNDLGPTARFGPFPIGVRTIALSDPSRLDVQGTGPRPVTIEVYYPSTPAAVAGVPRDVAKVLGVDVVATPAFRDVDRAPGTFPLVVFSHGNNGIRIQSFFFAAHLASHGYVVVAPDHHGNTFVDTLLGIVDPQVAVNRPLDVRFVIDQLLAYDAEAGNFFAGAIDPARIGVSGHSFGGYTTLAVAGGDFGLGTFTDPRVKAIFPQAPFTSIFPDEFYATVRIPTLIVGGSIDVTTPFAAEQQRPFDLLPAGATIVGLADLIDAGHFTFSDFCEVPRNLLAFLGGFDEACTPRHLPWRHAHDIVNYLSLAFFDGVLNGDADALARLDPAGLARIEDLAYQRK